MQTWIYVVADTGYDTGVKVGHSSTRGGFWKCVPSYSPRPMRYVAAWRVPLVLDQAISNTTAAKTVERNAHCRLGPPLQLPTKELPRNGKEWFPLTISEALNRLSDHFQRGPDVADYHERRRNPVTWDDFRNPVPSKLGSYSCKIVAWIYRECLTGRIKTQINDEWRGPFEQRRRYSRVGIEEIAAFTYEGPPSAAGNERVYRAWCHVMNSLGSGDDERFYGWLAATANAGDAISLYGQAKLTRIPLDRDPEARPLGVRRAYNQASSPEDAVWKAQPGCAGTLP